MAKKKNKVPKTVMGTSLPKFFRKNNWVQALLGNPVGRQILADALIAAAGAAAYALTQGQVGEKTGRAVAEGGDIASEVIQNVASAATGALADAARKVTGSDDRQARGKH